MNRGKRAIRRREIRGYVIQSLETEVLKMELCYCYSGQCLLSSLGTEAVIADSVCSHADSSPTSANGAV